MRQEPNSFVLLGCYGLIGFLVLGWWGFIVYLLIKTAQHFGIL